MAAWFYAQLNYVTSPTPESLSGKYGVTWSMQIDWRETIHHKGWPQKVKPVIEVLLNVIKSVNDAR